MSATFTVLQWGRALVSAEGAADFIALQSAMALQWGRALVSAEGCRSPLTPTRDDKHSCSTQHKTNE